METNNSTSTGEKTNTPCPDCGKKFTIWKWVGIGSSIAFLGALAYIFLGGKSKN